MMQVFDSDGITEALDTAQGGGRGHYTAIKVIGNTRLYDGKAKNDRERIFAIDGIGGALRSTDYKEPQKVAIPVIGVDRVTKGQNGRRFKEDGDPMFALTGQDRHGVAIEVDVIGCINYNQSNKYQKGIMDGCARSLKATDGHNPQGVAIGIPLTDEDLEELENAKEHPGIFAQLAEDCIVYCVWYDKYECYIAIRKLTPRECFRLQGWDDEYFDRAQMVNSDSQLYKQAGNGVTVSVIYEIARKMEVS